MQELIDSETAWYAGRNVGYKIYVVQFPGRPEMWLKLVLDFGGHKRIFDRVPFEQSQSVKDTADKFMDDPNILYRKKFVQSKAVKQASWVPSILILEDLKAGHGKHFPDIGSIGVSDKSDPQYPRPVVIAHELGHKKYEKSIGADIDYAHPLIQENTAWAYAVDDLRSTGEWEKPRVRQTAVEALASHYRFWKDEGEEASIKRSDSFFKHLEERKDKEVA